MAKDNYILISKNKRVNFDYEVIETFEAGVVLLGSEVKSLRTFGGKISESFVEVEPDLKCYIHNFNINKNTNTNKKFNHDPKRKKLLLLHKKEIAKIYSRVREKGFTIVCRSAFFNVKGVVKLEICLVKGKKEHDKRRTIKERDWARKKKDYI